MMDHLLFELLTNPIFVVVSFLFLFAIIAMRARDRKQESARKERERLKRRI